MLKSIGMVAKKARLLSLSLFLFGYSLVGSAQEIDYGNKEVGVDLLGIVFGGNQITQSFFFKNLKLKQKSDGFGFVRRGYRIRLGYEFSRPDARWSGQQTSGIRFRSERISHSRFLLRSGYEWRRRIKSIEFLYGLDIHLARNFQRDVEYTWIVDPSSPLESEQTTRSFYLGLSPIGGLYYHFNSNYALALESVLFFNYTDLKSTRNWIDQQTMEESFSKTVGQGYQFYATPVYTISFMVKF